MKKTSKVIAALAIAVLVFTFAGCTRKTSLSPASAPPPAVNDNCYTPAEADNLLSFDLYNWNKSESDNVFFSPFSIITALAMAQEGAKGQTAYEMQKVLYLVADDAKRREGFQKLIAGINAPGKKFQLSTSNHLWLEQTFQLLPSYIDVCGDYYSASVTNLDFINNPGGSAQTINDTVSNETNGKITNLVPPSAIRPTTKLILTNAIYFKADWLSAFTTENTYQQNFHLSESQAIPVSMMHQNLLGAIVEDYYGKAQVLEKPYVDKEVSMFVFLPPQGGMADLEGQMTGDKLNAWFASRSAPGASVTQVALALPKFKYETSYSLVDTLKKMGMNAPFNKTADFSGIDGKMDLLISDVLHKAFVAVDEKGTEAAAATAVLIKFKNSAALMPPPTIPFVVDRPFIFILYENTAGTVLFMGKVNDPTKG